MHNQPLSPYGTEKAENHIELEKVADGSSGVIVTGAEDIKLEKKTAQHDEAFESLASDNRIQYVTEDENALILKKIDWHIMPVLSVLFFLQLMDKQTLIFSSVFGLSIDTGLVGDQYSLLGSIVYIAQLILQPFSLYFLVKFRLSVYVPIIVTCWGATLAIMASARSFTGLIVGRFFLGAFETSIIPSLILIVQMWYRRHEQGYRIAIWYSSFGLVNVFGSLIVFGLGHIESDVLYTYQIVFLLLGTVTFVVGLLSFFLFPDDPVKSNFLSPEEKLVAVERLRANQQGVETKVFKIYQVLEMISDPKSWCWMTLNLLTSIPGAGIGIFGPLILRGFGFDKYKVMLLNIPLGVLQVLMVFIGVWATRRFNVKSPIVLASLVPTMIGTVILLRTGRQPEDQPTLLVAFYLLSSLTAMGPILISWQASNVAGHTKKATTAAFMNVGMLIGNIVRCKIIGDFERPSRSFLQVGPLLYAPRNMPYYHGGLMAMLICLILAVCFVFVVVFYLHFCNKRNERRRMAAGKEAKISDYSMFTMHDVQVTRAKEAAEKGGGSNTLIGRQAFDDLTDLQNDEFIYVY